MKRSVAALPSVFLLASFAAAAQAAITPSGAIIFPEAPPPAGDTSTFSGAGPNVSTGPVVGPGPELGAGPTVGEMHELALLRQEIADEDALRQDARTARAERRAATLQSLDILRRAEASLAAGDSDGVDDLLVRAEAALWGRRRLDVEAAREALSRSDLAPAREFLEAALNEARR